MKNRIFVILFIFSFLTISCEKPTTKIGISKSTLSSRNNNTLAIVQKIHRNTSLSELAKIMPEIVHEISLASTRDMPSVYEALEILHNQPEIVNSLIKLYEIQQDNYDSRLMIISIVGELKRSDAFPFLRELVWTDLPPTDKKSDDGLQPQDYEEIIQAKAVQGIAYLNREDSKLETIKIIENHKSRHVRITAIDAYMWNNGDSQTAAETLIESIPPEFHKFIDRPRFHRNMDEDKFNQKLTKWIEKWDSK